MELVQQKKRSAGKKLAPHKPATVAEFETWEAKRQADYNYEFYHGEIIKKPVMKQMEAIIVTILSRTFSKTIAYLNGGELIFEIDVYIDPYRKRISDVYFYTAEQIKAAAKGEKVVPAFAIEILFDSETILHVETKIQD